MAGGHFPPRRQESRVLVRRQLDCLQICFDCRSLHPRFPSEAVRRANMIPLKTLKTKFFSQICGASVHRPLGRHRSVDGSRAIRAGHFQSKGSSGSSAVLARRFLQRHSGSRSRSPCPEIQIRHSGVSAPAGRRADQGAIDRTAGERRRLGNYLLRRQGVNGSTES